VEIDEKDLVRRCLVGDQAACTSLVDAYARMVGTVIWRATNNPNGVEDLVQDTFLRVFRGLAYFDVRAKLSTWIYTIAHNVAIDHLRKSGRLQGARLDPAMDGGMSVLDMANSAGTDPEAALSLEEMRRFIRDGMAQLPEKYRLPLVYTAIEELDYPTVAVMLGLPIGTLKTLVFRGKRILKDHIEKALRQKRAGGDSHAM
jgi:RNA polymerase sigma-70 factor, ECF subfamily